MQSLHRHILVDLSVQSQMLPSNILRRSLEKLLASVDLQLVRRSSLASLGWNDHPIREGCGEERLTVDRVQLESLRERYRGHPGAESGALWSDAYVRKEIDARAVRADNAYLWQTRNCHLPIQYALSMLYAQRFDPLGLWGSLTEDGALGAHVLDIDGVLVSRDLIDSVIELNFLEEALSISERSDLRIIDIGAGYGRLAYRTTAALSHVEYVCTDGVPMSTLLCDAYLHFRRSRRTWVVPLDEISEVLQKDHFDLALNIHSFSECPLSAITWWVGLLAATRVRHLMIVPSEGLMSQERDGTRIDYLHVLEDHGYSALLRRPKYAHSETTQRYGIFPTEHALFALET